jgi:hypothetical protein
MLIEALAGNTYPNLFDAHPPFQIDGNFGGTSGVAEMLIQSHLGTIDLLPALPSAWPNGSITGLRARGGFNVDITWQNGKLASATIHNISGDGPARIRHNGRTEQLNIKRGQSLIVNGDLNAMPARASNLRFENEVREFTRAFGMMLNDGVAIVPAMERIIRRQTDAQFKALLSEISAGIQQGETISDLLRRYPAVFSPEYIAAIRRGEVEGELDTVMLELGR